MAQVESKTSQDDRAVSRERQRHGTGCKLRFIVEKHDSRRMHFDFRLELDGELKSWAVTYGPSLDPSEKRLAVRIDDPPIDKYAAFARHSGPTPVDAALLWDAGRWIPRGDPHAALESGVLQFELDGDRLKGAFALVRLGKNGKAKRENWLLIKGQDGYARKAADPPPHWTSRLVPGEDASLDVRASDPIPMRKGSLPEFIPPQLATLVLVPPEGNDWLHEIKYDGYRAIAAVGEGHARIFTRSGQDWSAKFPRIAAALERIKAGSAVLDGEIVALDEEGRSNFARLQHGLKAGQVPLTYFVFDLLELDGRDLRTEPLVKRKEKLRKLLQGAPDAIRFSEDVAGHGDEVLARACRMGLEGIVSKRADKGYESRRTQSWLKTKCTGNDEFVIGGYRVSTKKGRAFASLLLGEFEGKELHYRGRVGTGFDDHDLQAIGAQLAKIARKTSPFVDPPREITRDARWVEPRLVAQIAFTERTRDGLLRHPAFLGLRQDKPAKDVQSQVPIVTAAEGAQPGGSRSAAADNGKRRKSSGRTPPR